MILSHHLFHPICYFIANSIDDVCALTDEGSLQTKCQGELLDDQQTESEACKLSAAEITP